MAARIAIEKRDPTAWPCDVVHLSTDALAALHAHERDATIRFDEDAHLYYVHGQSEPLPVSVTGVVHALYPKRDSAFFLGVMNPEKRKTQYGDATDAEVLQIWANKGKDSALRGTRMHAAIEGFMNTFDPVVQWGYLSRDPTLEDEMAKFAAFMRHEFLGKHKLEPWRTEMLVHNDAWLAGSIDMIARSTATGEFYVLDWKRVDPAKFQPSKFMDYSDLVPECKVPHTTLGEYSIQLHVYRHMLMEHYGFPYIPPNNLYLVVIHPSAVSYRMIQCLDLSHAVPKIMAKRDEIIARHHSPSAAPAAPSHSAPGGP
jgi:hypothetical protein